MSNKYRKFIVYNRNEDGGVSITNPSLSSLRILQNGGGFGPTPPRGVLETQIERHVQSGSLEDAANSFVNAFAFGGVIEKEALKLIVDKDCLHLGTQIEVINKEELPSRFYRNAWYRSSNGGPININLDKAKNIHWNTLYSFIRKENIIREKSFEFKPLIEVPWNTLRSNIRHARDIEELQKIWINI